MMSIGFYGFSQDNKFKVEEVSNVSQAKPVIEILRSEFLYNVNFNDSTNYFIVPNNQYLNLDDLNIKLTEFSYIIKFENSKHIKKWEIY